MNTRWWVGAAVLTLLAASSGAALAQGRGQRPAKQESRDQARKGQREARPESAGAARAQGRQEAREEFRDNDRELANNWAQHNRANLPPGLRNRDRLPPGIERKLQRGYIIEPALREQIHPAPPQLVRVFAPAPAGFRYVVFGGHVVLLDPRFRIADIIRVNINIGS